MLDGSVLLQLDISGRECHIPGLNDLTLDKNAKYGSLDRSGLTDFSDPGGGMEGSNRNRESKRH